MNKPSILLSQSLLYFLLIAFCLNTSLVHAQDDSMPFDFSSISLTTAIPLKNPSFITVTDGTGIAYYPFMPVEKPKAIMLFYHGGGLWSNGIYQKMARELATKYSIATYLVDIRGHGNSSGARGDAPTAERVWQDINDVLVHIKKEADPTVPIILAGHSSGAGLILNYSGWSEKLAVDGYLLCAPYLGPRSKANRDITDAAKRFAKSVRVWVFIAKMITGWRIFNNIPTVFFNYPEWIKKSDTKILDYYTCAMSEATSPQDPEKLFEQLDTPVAVFIGECDEQFVPEEVINYAQRVRNSQLLKAEILPNITHLSILDEAPALVSHMISSFASNR